MSSPKQFPPASLSNSAYSLSKPCLPAYRQLFHQPMLSCQPVLIPPNNSHVLIRMPQVFSILPTDAIHRQAQTIPPSIFVSPSVNQLSQVDSVPVNSSLQRPSITQLNRQKTPSDDNNQLNKTMKKKKASPSAKRRSRLRMMAFLEAKKLANPVEESTLSSKSGKVETVKEEQEKNENAGTKENPPSKGDKRLETSEIDLKISKLPNPNTSCSTTS